MRAGHLGHEHESARPAAQEALAGAGLPVVPVWHGTVERLKGQDIEFALDYIEQLLAVRVDVRPHVEARTDHHFERRRQRRVISGDLDGRIQAAPGDAPPCSRQQHRCGDVSHW
jgi:hypothetical protein